MKKLGIYEEWGFETEDEVFNFLIETLKDSIYTWDYFVDWEKIRNRMEDLEVELNMLNSLIGKENIEQKFIELMEEYPRVKKVLPLLIAVRQNKLRKMSILKDSKELKSEPKREYFKIRRDIDTETREELLSFFNNSGLKEVLQDKDIKSVQDYYFGVEVGMDTNARKNRTGFLMESLVEDFLKELVKKKDSLEYICQARKEKIESRFNKEIKIDKSNRKFDFALINKEEEDLFLFETNFYSSGGSKLKSTAGEYQYLNNFLKNQELALIWITDGKGWNTAVNPLHETFLNNDYVFNLEMLKRGVLREIIL